MGSPAPIAWASWMVCSCSFQPLYGKTKHVEKPCDNMESQGSSWTQPPSCAFKGGRHSRHVSKALLDPLTCPSPSWITSNDLHMEQKNHLADPWITQIPDPWNYEQEWYGGGFKSLSLGCFVTYQWIRNKHCRILWLRLRGWTNHQLKLLARALSLDWHLNGTDEKCLFTGHLSWMMSKTSLMKWDCLPCCANARLSEADARNINQCNREAAAVFMPSTWWRNQHALYC